MARYGKKSQKQVKEAMHKMKRGKLKSGRSGKTVRSRKQAIAIGLSEARKKGAKVPPAKKKSSGARKSSTRKKSRSSSRSRASASSRTTQRSTSRRAKKSASPTRAARAAPSESGNITTDHEFIQRWVEERNGKPSRVIGTGGGEDPGMLRIDFPGYSGEGTLEEIPWEEFFEKFDENQLAFLYQEKTSSGELSRFNKFVRRE
jgi:hypothetical protein